MKELVENRLYQYNNNFKEAFATELIHKNGNPIHSVRLIEKPSNLIGISKGHPKSEVYKYYEAGGNHHLCIFGSAIFSIGKVDPLKSFKETLRVYLSPSFVCTLP